MAEIEQPRTALAATEPTASAPAAAQLTTPRPSSSQPKEPPSRACIRQGDNVLLKLPSGIIKPVRVQPNVTISLGKYGSFKGHELVGRPYGHTYEISEDGKLSTVQVTLHEIEETEANNEFITSSGAQALSFVDIKALKDRGLSGREIIQKQIEEHKTYELKTEYSKEKYMKKKEAKYLQMFTPLEPTVHQIAQYHFEKQASKTRELRPDTLANMLAMVNVRPGSRLLVIEDIGGLLVAAALERMGGEGRICVINDADSPPDLHLLEHFNFSPSDLAPITSIHWAATDESWSPPDLPLELAELDKEKEREAEAAKGMGKEGSAPKRNTRELHKLRKRKATFEKVQEARDEYFRGGVLIASEYDPLSVIERLLPSIGGSAPIVIYSQNVQLLFAANLVLRNHPAIISPTITEPFLRQYQVLPGRTHPEMQGMSHGGYILSMIRVLENADAQAVGIGGRRGKKRGAAAVAAELATEQENGDSRATSVSAGEPDTKRVKVDEASGETSGATDASRFAEAMQVEGGAA
ncbi:eukaryotic translation initiation factor 3 62 kDa subunit [Rhodotorula toruloides]|uniref:tRNA (adenine(58)-N(1))-methyltransferase non-catalytic subunit TRM6 n=1 Tax=Rhodotorula toruloides TaxID=5286 RepID=A0A511KAD9_RHOTO|nr:eukaryotic translation initiation factor 3 62 kDa subunit [Rhodotorula toruloides]